LREVFKYNFIQEENGTKKAYFVGVGPDNSELKQIAVRIHDDTVCDANVVQYNESDTTGYSYNNFASKIEQTFNVFGKC